MDASRDDALKSAFDSGDLVCTRRRRVDFRLPAAEGEAMRCRVCGGRLTKRVTDLPFKTSDTAIVMVKGLPVLQCSQCNDVELEHPVMVNVERMLDSVDGAAELEILRYAA